MSEQTEKEKVYCNAVCGRMCGVGRKRESLQLLCGQPAKTIYVNAAKQKRLGRCAEHDSIDLTMPENKGWSREP